MRRTVLAGLLACGLVFAGNSAKADALSSEIATMNNQDESVAILLADVTNTEVEVLEKEKLVTDVNEEKPVIKHSVQKGESLEKIAKAFDTEWKRIYDKNESIENPDLINPGDELVIPDKEEKLEPRELPVVPEVVMAPAPATRTVKPARSTPAAATRRQPSPAPTAPAPAATRRQPSPAPTAPAPAPAVRGTSSGNMYSRGYCTWYVKNIRTDLPNNLGNADTWAARASAQGYATGTTPRVGAVAQAVTGYMHVAYVSSVNGDGTVTVSEMNFRGWNVVSTRTVPASSFIYIY